MATEVHIWQPGSGGDSLGNSWNTPPPASQGTLTADFTGSVPVDGQSITIDSLIPSFELIRGETKVYVWKTVLAGGGSADQILIGANATANRDNFVAAVNANPALAGISFGTGTVASVEATATTGANDTAVLTSVRYGWNVSADGVAVNPFPGGLADAMVISFAHTTTGLTLPTNFTGSATYWSLAKDVEVIFDENNHSDMTDNLDWNFLLLTNPRLKVLRVTKKDRNESNIGSSGNPWILEGVDDVEDNIFNLRGSANLGVYITITQSGRVGVIQSMDGEVYLVSGSAFVGLNVVVVQKGTLHCYSQFGVAEGGAGTRCFVTGVDAVLNILDSSLSSAGLLVVLLGTCTNVRPGRPNCWTIIGPEGRVVDSGIQDGREAGLVNLGGSYFGKPVGENSSVPNNIGTSIYSLLGETNYDLSNFAVNVTNTLIGRDSVFASGRVSDLFGKTLDLRERYP